MVAFPLVAFPPDEVALPDVADCGLLLVTLILVVLEVLVLLLEPLTKVILYMSRLLAGTTELIVLLVSVAVAIKAACTTGTTMLTAATATIVLALMAAGFCMALGAPAHAGCVGLSGTADGFDKETAVSRAQLALADYVKQYKAEKRLRAVTVSAMRASPQPYWRSSVSENQFCFGINCGIYKPDIVNARSHTICWQIGRAHV